MAPADQHILKARSMVQAGRAKEAETLLRQLLKRMPGEPLLYAELARALSQLGKRDQAMFFAKSAAASRNVDAVESAVVAFGMLGDADAAIETVRRAIALDPSRAYSQNDLGVKLLKKRELDEARVAIERAFALSPDDENIAANIALIYSETWSLEEGLEVLRKFRDRNPGSAMLQHQMPYLSNYSDRVTPDQLFEEHRRFGELLGKTVPPLTDPPLVRPTAESAERTLRVGFLSGDFREHSVSRFLEPILKSHDPKAVHYTLFPVVPKEDATSRRFKAMAEGWNTCAMLPERDAAAAIRRERIDILIDLAGLTKGMRVGILIARGAPVQINYLGYPNTTAMPNVDVRIVDSITDPAGAEAYATERLHRLDPCFLCFAPPPIAREIPARGAAADGPVTFASFNFITKVTPTTLDMWTEILRQVPDARLLLKATALSHAGVRERISKALTSRGIDPGRFELIAYLDDLAAHYRLYHRVDVALDPFPYHGTTTTCEALYMGVPVVTLAGDRHPARVGVSLLSAVGSPELVARTREEYIAKAAKLARDPERRTQYHPRLRDQLARSPLGDASAFTRRFEGALREVWRQKCSEP